MTVTLRPYQEEALDALNHGWAEGKLRLAVVLPTGTGKTTVFSVLAGRFVERTRKRVLVVAHTEELIQQAVSRLRLLYPSLKIGIVKAGVNQPTAHIVVGSVATLRNAKRRAQIKNVGLVIIDETHRAAAATYQTIIEHYGCIGDDASTPLAGFTATFVRGDQKKLGDTFEDVVYTKSIEWAIRNGYLINFRGKRVVVPDLDLRRVRTSGGDFKDSDLADELERSLAPQVVAEAFVEHAADRKAIGFAPTVDSAFSYAEAFQAVGITAAVVSGQTPAPERRLIVKQLHAGEVQIVWNCGVFTEGFDVPSVSAVVMGRPTKSEGLYVQMAGRGGRPDPLSTVPVDQQDCLLLDVAGASKSMSLRTWIDLSTSPAVAGELELDDLLSVEETLDEIEEETKEASEKEEIEEYDGDTETVDFDPVQRTTGAAWMRTDAGVPFLAAEGRYWMIVPTTDGAEDTYDGVWLTETSAGTVSGKQADVIALGLTQEACTHAIEDAIERTHIYGSVNTVSAKAAWRKAPATDAQRRMLYKQGVSVPDDQELTKGEAADMITQRKGSRRIDFILSFMRQGS